MAKHNPSYLVPTNRGKGQSFTLLWPSKVISVHRVMGSSLHYCSIRGSGVVGENQANYQWLNDCRKRLEFKESRILWLENTMKFKCSLSRGKNRAKTLLRWWNQMKALCLSVSSLKRRTLTFSSGKKKNPEVVILISQNSTSFNIRKSPTGHLVQAVTPSKTALTVGCLAFPQVLMGMDAHCLVKQFITFWAGLIFRQLSLTCNCHLLPCSFNLLVPVLSSGASWVDIFLFSNEGASNASMLFSDFHQEFLFIWDWIS